LRRIEAHIDNFDFIPGDGVPSETSEKLVGWKNIKEFTHCLSEQLLGTFMSEARNESDDVITSEKLKAIGLEIMELTSYKKFLGTNEFQLDEEKIFNALWNKSLTMSYNGFKWALDFLREKTRISYRNGEIGTVRQLCILALEKINQGQLKKINSTIDLKDWAWAFIFMFYCLKYDSEYHLIESTYQKFANGIAIQRNKRPDATASPYAVILNFIFDIYTPVWTKISI